MTLECSVFSFDESECGVVHLEPELFSAPFRLDIVSRVIRWQNAKSQAGTHATKVIGDVSGTGKKPYKQKGTGRARHGSLRSPQFRGGAVIFGPQVRSHAHDLPKKVRKLGLKIALSYKISEQSFHVCRSFELPEARLKFVQQVMKKFDFSDALFIGNRLEAQNLIKSIGNLKGFDFLPVEGLNVLDIMRKKNVIVGLSALDVLKGRLS